MKPYIIANWKMNPEKMVEAKKLFSFIKKGLGNSRKARVIICPPFVYLSELEKIFASDNKNYCLKFGAQNVFWEKKGSYTGEISPGMLKAINVKYVIIGHSERRRYFQETDEMINKKIKSALSNKLKPILCIGETKKERERGETRSVLKRQLSIALSRVPFSKTNPPLIAYEPIWAIGSEGSPCDTKEAENIALFVRKTISKIYNKEIGEKTAIFYGGSVNSNNYKQYLSGKLLNGLLIGRASLNADDFIKIAKLE